MRPKKNKVYLNEEQRVELNKIVKSGTHSAEKIRRANILLLLDENHPPVKTQEEIAQLCHTNPNTISHLAKRFQNEGLDILNRKQCQQPPRKRIVTGDVEAHIIAINCSEPPAGHSRWTLSLTAEKLVELNIVPSISRDTVARALKKRIKAPSK
jgi:transposase